MRTKQTYVIELSLDDIKKLVRNILLEAGLPVDNIAGWGIYIKLMENSPEPELETLVVTYRHDRAQ